MRTVRKLCLLAALIIPPMAKAEPRLGYITYGPMFHWNFGNDEFKSFSYGFEIAYWNYSKEKQHDGWFDNVPDIKRPGYGMDLGIDMNLKSIRLYAEPQVGWIFAGLALGPVAEFSREGSPARLGVQGSGWLNALAGFDFRYRRLGGENTQAVGMYGKLGNLVSGRE
ncbi:MAG: hypothetical protein JWP91_822 [Fibrobacteres bacterium]|nr:hypothetical protein [Fibrobacterota bacterium]